MNKTIRYKIKEWNEFQHYHKPNPTWIKLYKKIAYDRSIMTLDDFTFKLLICCWLFACEDKTNTGILPVSDDIAYSMHKPKQFIDKHLESLASEGLVVLYSNSRDCLGQRREEGETKEEKRQTRRNLLYKYYFIEKLNDNQTSNLRFMIKWCRFIKMRILMKKSVTKEAAHRVMVKLNKFGMAVQIEALSKTLENQWQGVFPEKAQRDLSKQTARQPDSQLTAVSQFRDEEAEKLF